MRVRGFGLAEAQTVGAYPKAMPLFWGAVAGLLALRVLYGVLTVPEGAVMPLTLLSAVLFVAGPTLAMVAGAGARWTVKSSLAYLIGGVAVQALMTVLLRSVLPESGFLVVLVQALAQGGLMIWCLGLGALVSLLLKEKALIPPVAIFLAGFDIFLVFSPTTWVNRVVNERPEVLASVAGIVPQARGAEAAAEGLRVVPLAYIGPADLLFLATLFACIWRFGLKVRESAIWTAAILVVYLVVVLAGVPALPALVPIGVALLIVNRREFGLTKEERQATWGVAVVSVLLAAYGIYSGVNRRPGPQAAPSPTVNAPAPEAPAETPAPTP